MSKDRKKLLHIHSSVNDKQPTPATLELGELGVNNAKGNAFISTKNSDGEVVRFSEDETIIGWMEQKEVFPYEGYMRGADNSQVDGVTEQDLLDNKSNLIIKLNQVVPENTDYSPYDEKVNGAKDIYGNLINPISSGGYKDGAGLAIDMSNYAMIGANPSFSSITTTCHATLNGTTEIKGSGDGCGSKFTVEVANACIDATDTLNEYGVNHSNFGTSCDGTKISNDTTLKGKKIFIDSPSGDLTVDIQACNHISGRTNDFVIRECQDNAGKVEIDTTDIDVSASTTDFKSCDRISAITNDFQIKECVANGKAGISSTTINNSASTIDENACTHISEVTNQFNITECTDGQGTTAIKSCNGISAITDNFIVEQCNSGTTHIHSCAGITLESKNITLTDGNCGSGQTTIEVNDLCLVGERKINIYGDETNVGIDCDDNTIATNTRVFGKGTLITTKSTPSAYSVENNVEIVAAQDIKENADRDINESTTNGNINESAKNINNTASNDICDTAANNATFYGAIKTNVGINCDDTATAATTTVKGGKVIVDASATNLGLTAKQDILESAERDITITANDDICETAGNEATFYGVNITRLGINCAENDRSTLTRVSGDTVNVGGNDITVHADDLLCESGKTVTIFASEGGKLTIGGNSCDGNTSGTYPITYWRNPEAVCDNGVVGFSSTTVDNALDEVYYRSQVSMTSTGNTTGIDVPVPESGTSIVRSGSTTYTIHQDSDGCDKTYDFTVDNTIVSMSAYTYSAAEELAKKYTLWQYIGDKRVEIGEINIPKDHILKDVSVVWGTLNGSTFTPCTQASENCHWYIKLVWNVFDPSTGHQDDKVTYLPADDFVKDIDENNSNTDRGANVDVWYDGKQNWVSADTKLNFDTTNGDFKYEKHDGQHWESGTTLTFEEGSFSASTYQPWVTSKTIKVPTSLDHLIEYNGSCYVLNHDICMEDNTIVANGFYSKSDKNLKENIKAIPYEDYHKASSINLKSFNFKDDETKTKTYGVIAQDLQAVGLDNIVHKDDKGNLNVDYTSFLILRIASLESQLKSMEKQISELMHREK